MNRCLFAFVLCASAAASAVADWGFFSWWTSSATLAEDGGTRYVISIAPDATKTDRFAAQELADHLRQATGATFPIAVNATAERRIELGTARAREIVAARHPAPFREEESAYAVTDDGTLAIWGKGPTGNAYGVYAFLERELGCLWLTAMGDTVVPARATLKLAPAFHAEKPKVGYRGFVGGPGAAHMSQSKDILFYFRNRINQIECNYQNVRSDLKGALVPRIRFNEPNCHSFHVYLPPDKYFKDHPDWYMLEKDGTRTPYSQLCFAKREMRDEFTRQFLAHARKIGGKGLLDISQRDNRGPLCYCPDCRACVEKYKSPGSPLYSYLHELAPIVKREFPELVIHFLAYRKDSTQRPPVGMEPFPDNVAVVFAPLDDDFTKDIAHPNNCGTLEDFRGWSKLAKMWLWSYPTIYATPTPPFGGLERAQADLRILAREGLLGTQIEHDVGKLAGLGFFDLQMWMLVKGLQDPETDWRALRDTFCRAYYGAAADDVIAYDEYLEAGRRDSTVSLREGGRADGFITPEDLVKWEARFDEMERKVGGEAAIVQHLRETRLPLDVAALVRWRELDRAGLVARLGGVDAVADRATCVYRAGVTRRFERTDDKMVNERRERALSETSSFLGMVNPRRIVAKGGLKPLPETFASIPKEKIFEVVPVPPSYGERFEKDPAAASGYTRVYTFRGPTPKEKSFTFGVRDGAKGYVFEKKFAERDLVLGQYHFYHLGKYKFQTGACSVSAFANPRFRVSPQEACFPGDENELDVWASFKIDGPYYGGTSADGKSRVSMDRVVFIRN